MAAGAVTVAGVAFAAERWTTRTLSRLRERGVLVDTAHAVIEYSVTGSGPPLLMFHATPGGYDEGLVLGRSLGVLAVIAPSRPGYL